MSVKAQIIGVGHVLNVGVSEAMHEAERLAEELLKAQAFIQKLSAELHDERRRRDRVERELRLVRLDARFLA